MPDPRGLEARLRACERERVAALDDSRRKAKRIADLEQEVADLEATVEGIYRSSSWRVSAPLRAPRQLMISVGQWRRWWRKQMGRAGSRRRLLGLAGQALAQAPLPALRGALARWRSDGRFRPTPISWPADRYDYSRWLARYGDPVADTAVFPADPASGPLFSVLLPVFNAPPALLEQAIDSVRDQTWPHWELCIADDASTDPAVAPLLERKATEDSRIRVVRRDRNGHISAATNSALSVARGDYVALLDQDDLLAPQALAAVAAALEQQPDAVILYSDEDRIDAEGGERSDPYFKPDFNYALFLSQNMVSHLGVYRRAEVEAVGGLREGLEGSQDHDLALRVLERIRHDQVVHIPRVLYHWRAIAGSTALDVGEKGYAFQAGARAIQEHLRRTEQSAVVEPCRDLAIFHALRQPLPASPRLHIWLGPGAATPGHGAAATATAISTALEALQPDWWLSAACREAQSALAEGPGSVQVMDDATASEAGLTATLQRLAATLEPGFVLLVDLPIARGEPGWLEALLGWAHQPWAGFVGPRVWDADERMDYGGVLFPTPERACYAHQGWPIGTESFQLYGYGGRALLHQRFSAVAPQLALVRTEVLSQGLADSAYQGRLGLLAAMLKAHQVGLHNLWIPQASVWLPAGGPVGADNLLAAPDLPAADRRQWQADPPAPQPDPAYHPRLSRRGDFSLPWPP